MAMNAAVALNTARVLSGLSLRELARRAGTSHSTLIAYETGNKVPSVETFDRVMRSAGYTVGVELTRSVGGADPAERGRELAEVLDLAAHFPARHASTIECPPFRKLQKT